MNTRWHQSCRPRNARGSSALAFVLVAAPACGGESLQLERADEANDPAAFITNQVYARAILVDESRVYWATGREPRASLRSCLKDDCGASAVTYVTLSQNGSSMPFVVAALGEQAVYWQNEGPILSCPAGGCSGSPTPIAAYGASSLVVDGDYIYWTSASDTAVFRCSLSGCSSPTVIALHQLDAAALGVAGDNAYWLSNSRVMRAKKDGSETPVVMADAQTGAACLAVNSKHVFWSHGEDSGGQVSFCPLAGCEGTPTDLVVGEHSASGLRVDDQRAYWINADLVPQGFAGALRAIDLKSGAVPATLHVGQFFPTVFEHTIAIDANFVYWVAAPALDPKGNFDRQIIYRQAK